MTDTSRTVPAASVANLRRLDGIPLRGGRAVRPGLLFRSGQLDRLDPAEPAVADLGLRTVVDLRTAAERAAAPDRLPDGATHLVADVLADAASTAAAPVLLEQIFADPKRLADALGGGRAAQRLEATYRTFVTAESARAAYAELLRRAADPASGPLLFHCTAGKDRTGWAAALLLLLLGADEADIRAEYLAVNPAVHAAFDHLTGPYLAAGGDPEISDALIGVRPAYLDAALAALHEDWSTPETYALKALHLTPTELDTLRTRLTR